MGLLDQIGPVMVGPSSSHTAGACRLALLARHALGGTTPRSARLVLHGSFAKTAKGHGTDLALAGGLLGFMPDDPRIREAFTHAEAAGLQLEYVTADLGDIHPNSARLELTGHNEESVSVLGSSLGAGFVRVTQVNGFDVHVSGSYHTLLALHTDRPGVIARVAGVVADDDGNIATAFSARQKRGGHAMMSVEIDKPLAPYAIRYLQNLPYIHWLRMLPEVMHGSEERVTETETPPVNTGWAEGSEALE